MRHAAGQSPLETALRREQNPSPLQIDKRSGVFSSSRPSSIRVQQAPTVASVSILIASNGKWQTHFLNSFGGASMGDSGLGERRAVVSASVGIGKGAAQTTGIPRCLPSSERCSKTRFASPRWYSSFWNSCRGELGTNHRKLNWSTP